MRDSEQLGKKHLKEIDYEERKKCQKRKYLWKDELWIRSSVQSLSHVWLFATPWTVARQASLPITNSQSPPKPMSVESVMPSNHLILCHPLNLCQHQGLFKWVSSLHQVAKILEFQLQPQSFQWIIPMISFRMDWLDLLAVHGTLKNLFQHYSSKSINSSVLRFLYSPTFTSIHDYWKNHSFD